MKLNPRNRLPPFLKSIKKIRIDDLDEDGENQVTLLDATEE